MNQNLKLRIIGIGIIVTGILLINITIQTNEKDQIDTYNKHFSKTLFESKKKYIVKKENIEIIGEYINKTDEEDQTYYDVNIVITNKYQEEAYLILNLTKDSYNQYQKTGKLEIADKIEGFQKINPSDPIYQKQEKYLEEIGIEKEKIYPYKLGKLNIKVFIIAIVACLLTLIGILLLIKSFLKSNKKELL